MHKSFIKITIFSVKILKIQINKIKPMYYYLDKQLHIVLMRDENCIGYINLCKYINEDWEINSVVAEHGFGYRMFEGAMNFIYPQWFIPTRNKTINTPGIKIITRFLDRSDIETQKITVNDDSYVEISEKYDFWFNRRYRLKEKMNIDYEEVNYNFIKKTGIKLFTLKYPWGTEFMLD